MKNARISIGLVVLSLACLVVMGGYLFAGATENVSAVAAEEHTIVSPYEGFFYGGEYPGDPPIVRVGTYIEPGMTLGYVQGMEREPIISEVRGTVSEVLVIDMQVVSQQQPLFRVMLEN